MINKKPCVRSRWIVFILFTLLLHACGHDSNSARETESSTEKVSGNIAIPDEITAAAIDNALINAWITFDDGVNPASREAMLIANGTGRFERGGIPIGVYSVRVDFEFSSAQFGQVNLATAVKQSVTISKNETTAIVFSKSDFIYADTDNDDVFDLIELENNTNPKSANDKPEKVCTQANGVITCIDDRFTVGGAVIGLVNGSVTLLLNDNEEITIVSGSFVFTTVLRHKQLYRVTVKDSVNPFAQTCNLVNTEGDINKANVSDVNFSCTFNHAVLSDNDVCRSCHNGDIAVGKPSGHIETVFDCGICHGSDVWGPMAGIPAGEDFPLAYVKRSVAALGDLDLASNPMATRPSSATESVRYAPGGNLYMRGSISPTAPEINITARLTAPDPNDANGNKLAGDVSDPEVSYDGRKILFTMHIGEIENIEPENQPYTWNIWEYDIENDILARVIQSDLMAEEGNDVDPHYLPDGRIVFVSDRNIQVRSSQLTLSGDGQHFLDEQRQKPLTTLHVMDATGDNIKQISMNLSNDRNPVVLTNGKIAFARWDRTGPTDKMALYQTNPDGSEYGPLYGTHSHDSVNNFNAGERMYTHVRQRADSKLLATLMAPNNTLDGGDIVLIDQTRFVDNNAAKFGTPVSQGESGEFSITIADVNSGPGVSQFGRYTTPYPVSEISGSQNKVLVSWAPCGLTDINRVEIHSCSNANLSDPDLFPADPQYGIFLFNTDSQSLRPIVSPKDSIIITDPVPVVARTNLPTVISDKSSTELNSDLVTRNVGIIHIRSVYDTQGAVALVDRPLQPRARNTLMTSEVIAIPLTDILMDPVTKSITTDTSLPNLIQRDVANISVIADPVQTAPDNRVARFVRIIRAIPAISDIPNQAYGFSGGYEMREILGYAHVEPDGSVYVEVPAGEPFTVQVLDKAGRSFTTHDAVLQVTAGEVKVCNGCHSPDDGQPSINLGATMNDKPWPNTVGNLVPKQGETMAETRARQSCFTDCAYQHLDRDIVYTDVWTDPAETPRGEPISYIYSAANVPLLPIKGDPVACSDADWPSFISQFGTMCRVSINYADHVQPIWDADRLFDFDGDFIMENYKCANCHTTYEIDLTTGLRNQITYMNAMNNLVTEDKRQVPPGQFYFREGTVEDVGNGVNRVLSYADMLQNQRAFEIEPGTVNNLIPAIERDSDGNPILIVGQSGDNETIPVFRGYAEVAGGASRARVSHLVEVIFNQELRAVASLSNITPNTLAPFDHSRILSEGEKRLIIEWIDGGTQYYNDPASAPRVSN